MPQDLRALNLAAFEMVDYVVIDPNATPIENIRVIQPDLFAKGYEYTANGLPPKTQEEAEALRSLWRRDRLHAGRYRLFLVALDRARRRPT